jgi:triacylglycerol esterase/lipase EstA (alpha/beta hydrolase family)
MKIIIATLNKDLSDKISKHSKCIFRNPIIEIIENYEDIYKYINEPDNVFFIDNSLNFQNKSCSCIGKFTKTYKSIIKDNFLNIVLLSQDKENFKGLGHFGEHVVKITCGKSAQHYENRIFKYLNKLSLDNPKFRSEIKNKPKIFFVHGFSGNQATWNNLVTLINEDDDLKDLYDISYFNYPTFTFSPFKLLKIFVPRKYDTLEANALSLNTLIDSEKSKNITIVGHSLGGLIIRTFLIEYYHSQFKKVKKILLYAPANNGSNLATFLSKIYRNNIHLKILKKGNNDLINLNNRWKKSGIEDKLYIKAIIGLRDKTVSFDSSTSGLKRKNIETFVDKNHLKIKTPGTKGSNIYINLKKHIKQQT